LSQTAAEDASVLGTLIGFGVLLIGASGVFGEIQESLNQIWGVSSKRHPVFILMKERVFSFAMVFVMGFLMLVSFLFSAAVAAAGGWLHARFPGLDTSWNFGNAMISVVVIAMLFALIYRMVPDARIAWRDVWLGAVIAAVLFEVGRFLLGFYFGAQRHRLQLRRGWFSHHHLGVGVLFGADPLLWCRLHEGVCIALRITPCGQRRGVI
jgi:membrane protein